MQHKMKSVRPIKNTGLRLEYGQHQFSNLFGSENGQQNGHEAKAIDKQIVINAKNTNHLEKTHMIATPNEMFMATGKEMIKIRIWLANTIEINVTKMSQLEVWYECTTNRTVKSKRRRKRLCS